MIMITLVIKHWTLQVSKFMFWMILSLYACKLNGKDDFSIDHFFFIIIIIIVKRVWIKWFLSLNFNKKELRMG